MAVIPADPTDKKLVAICAIHDEIERADERWGIAHDPSDLVWYAVLGEECGEVGRCLNEPWPRPLTQAEQEALYRELTQVAAVAIRWMVRLKRREEQAGGC